MKLLFQVGTAGQPPGMANIYFPKGHCSDGVSDFCPVQIILYHSRKDASCSLFNQLFKEKSMLATHWALCYYFVLDAMLFY